MSNTSKITRSAQVLAARRAVATNNNDKIAHDQYAQLFINDEVIEFIRGSENDIHFVNMRHEIIEELFTNCVDVGVKQYLLLGAGFDSKFQRYKMHQKNCAFVELDVAGVIDFKSKILSQNNLTIPTFVSHFLTSPHELQMILKNYFKKNTPTFISAEGLFYYLEEPLFRGILDILFSYFGNQNIFLGFDMLHPVFFIKEKYKAIIERLKQHGEIFKHAKTHEDMQELFRCQNIRCEIWTAQRLAEYYYGVKDREGDVYTVIVGTP